MLNVVLVVIYIKVSFFFLGHFLEVSSFFGLFLEVSQSVREISAL